MSMKQLASWRSKMASYHVSRTGTSVQTPHGPCDIAELKVGDCVQTVDNGSQPHTLDRPPLYKYL